MNSSTQPAESIVGSNFQVESNAPILLPIIMS